MQTTLNIIKSHGPCKDGWETLLKSLGKTKPDDEPIDLITILKSNGIKDAIWCLRCFEYRDYCLFLADLVESVLPIYECYKFDNPAPRKAIKAIRDWHDGKISDADLKSAARAAAVAYAYADAAARAGDTAAYSAAGAAADACAAAYAAADAAMAAYACTGYATAAYAVARAGYATAGDWTNVEQLFIKHFGSN